MVNRAELCVIRGARAGDSACQLALGKLYLFGGASLLRNMPTALHWLHRAARQQQAEAWMLIGSHVPFEHARHCLDQVLPWYERAYAAGVEQAGQVLAQLAPSNQVESAPMSMPMGSGEQAAHAAQAGDRAAQLALGLWFARLQRDGNRQADGIAAVNFKRAIRWLTLAAEQGDPEAWFALSRIYLKPEFSQRSVAEAQVCLERAAALGHCGAQYECGMLAWRHRQQEADNDVRAVYWLQKAAAQACEPARQQLQRIAMTARDAAWLQALAPATVQALAGRQPLLAARLTLARRFGLNRAEALLLDVRAADRGHCLVVDIRASYRRSKRRVIALNTAQERQLLDQVIAQFDRPGAGVEGNYRQRLYRLKTCLAAVRSRSER